MDTEFMNSENSKISYPHRLSLNLSGKINLKRKDKYVVLSYAMHGKILKSQTKTINLKNQLQHGMKKLN